MNVKSADEPHTANRTTNSCHGATKALLQHLLHTYYVTGSTAGIGNTGVIKKQMWSFSAGSLPLAVPPFSF